MNTTFLKTLLAIRATGSFGEASVICNLSRSAVSVQMKRLEEELGRSLFFKGRRPAELTPFGMRFCEMAAPIVADFDRLMRSATENSAEGMIRIGFVSTTLQTLLPAVLDLLGERFPKLQVNAESGLSDDLANGVAREELDLAFVSAPAGTGANIRAFEFAKEPLKIIASPDIPLWPSPMEAISEQPYIGFNRNTRLGAQISQLLRENGVKVNQILELDSIDAIEHLVAQRRGVSVVPKRIFSAEKSDKIKSYSFDVKGNCRVLNLVAPFESDRKTITNAILELSVSHAS